MPVKKSTKTQTKTIKPEPAKPRLTIDWSLVDEMLLDMCEGNEIAAALCVSPETLYDEIQKRYKVEFEVYRDKKRAETIQNLRKAQLNLSKSNSTMSVWLGKQYLGQKDKHETSGNSGAGRVMPQIVIELHGTKSSLLNSKPGVFDNNSNDDDTSDNTENFISDKAED